MAPSTHKRLSSYFPMIALPVWMVILTYPYMVQGEVKTQAELGEIMFLNQISGIIAFSLLILIYRPNLMFRCPLLRMEDVTSVSLNLFFVLVLLSSFISSDPTISLLYCVATYGVILLFSRLWLEPWPRVRFGLLISGIGVFGLLGLALLIHGAPQNRFVGGVHPNQFSSFALMAMVALFFQGPKMRIAAYVIALSVALLVNSRGAIMSILVFGAFYLTLSWSFRITASRVLIIIGFISMIFLSLALLLLLGMEDNIWDLVLSITAINSPDRGFGSGLTGRTENWPLILEMITENPIFGVGFRIEKTIYTIRIHNAHLQLFLQVGVISGLLFVFLMFAQARRMAILSIKWLSIDEEKANIFRVIAAGIIMVVVNGMVEGIMINIGFPLPLLFLFLLAAPNRVLFPETEKKRSYSQ